MRLLLIGIVLAMIGCSTIPEPVPEYKKPDIVWPEPIKTEPINWQVKEINGEMFTLLTLADNQKLRINLADILRYQKSLKSMVCYYKETEDVICNTQEQKDP